jgi:hypothetical protein
MICENTKQPKMAAAKPITKEKYPETEEAK